MPSGLEMKTAYSYFGA